MTQVVSHSTPWAKNRGTDLRARLFSEFLNINVVKSSFCGGTF